MSKFNFSLFSIVFLLVFFSCKSNKKTALSSSEKNIRIGFYNVENLFDTIDIANKADEEFTPISKKKWNTQRYFKKLNDLAKVVEAMNYPAILGMCEVENKTVLEDFVSKTVLKNKNYGIVHHESPDFRGIDVALIYQKNIFKVTDSEAITIHFPKSVIGEDHYTTRDILHVTGILGGKEVVHIFVNHFPSRRGGLQASEPKRLYVAQQLKKRVDEIFANPNAKVIIMGDFNDEPANKSITNVLDTKHLLKRNPADLTNCADKLDAEGKGTYNYRGNWNLLDQIIVSSSMLKKNSKIKIGTFHIFQKEWMMYKSDKYGPTPSRTYGGPNYYGGYSDHLPVFVDAHVY
ncbi:MAG TPA: hypothetical protein ENJ53_06010 [Phaeodactylibacter sp.]|nr:hypothetical protein [Phaeodactylibacter sp.]